MTPLVIIPCGGKKAATPKPAANLYLGTYFKACLRYALHTTTPDRVRILSAKHGLLPLDKVVAPYDLRMGQRGCVTADAVQQQAQEQGIANEQDVRVVAGKDYADVALAVWQHATWVLQGVGGMGYQIQHLKRLTKAG